MREWIAFWDSPHSIYVNDRHRDVHYRTIAEEVRAYVPGPDARVLDYGCGEALHAPIVADAARELVLVDAAPGVRAGLAKRFGGHARIAVRAPEELAAEPDGSFDLIVMMSVAQYLSSEELDGVLALFRRLLKPSGILLLGDVIPPSVSPLADAQALLRYARENGFLVAAIGGLVRTALSDYRKLRAALGLAMYDEAAMRRKLAAAGFPAVRAPKNIGHNPARMTFVARRD